MGACPQVTSSTSQDLEMVPLDVVAGGDCVISNSGGVTHLKWPKNESVYGISVLRLFTFNMVLWVEGPPFVDS